MEVHGVGIIGVVSRATTVITHIKGLLTLLITTHEPPSMFLAKPKMQLSIVCTRSNPTGRLYRVRHSRIVV